jgi:hypothetical protein
LTVVAPILTAATLVSTPITSFWASACGTCGRIDPIGGKTSGLLGSFFGLLGFPLLLIL